jgi:hypothetical protein
MMLQEVGNARIVEIPWMILIMRGVGSPFDKLRVRNHFVGFVSTMRISTRCLPVLSATSVSGVGSVRN